MKNNKFSFCCRLESFAYAFNGLKIMLKEEHNARIHLIITVLVLAAGFVFNISGAE